MEIGVNSIKLLKIISFWLGTLKNTNFSFSKEEQKRYIYKFPNPGNDIDRSFYQYCCQMKLKGFVESTLLNIASLPLLIWLYTKKNDELIKEKTEALFVSEGVDSFDIIPQELKDEFGQWKEVIVLREYFDSCDKAFFYKILRTHPFDWHFLFKVLLKIKIYSYLIHSFSPKAIVIGAEFTFTSSILTQYCEEKEIWHINVMHGEKFFYMRDSFFRFTRAYVWDAHYIKLFKELRAYPEQFVLARPVSLCFEENQQKVYIDFTYYLAAEDTKTLLKIKKLLSLMKDHSLKVAVRPHPIYSDIDYVRRIFEGIEVEDTKSMVIYESLKRTKNAIALYSTVLNQACLNGTGVVIDDISQPDFFERLKDLDYIVLTKEHKLLSEVFSDYSILY